MPPKAAPARGGTRGRGRGRGGAAAARAATTAPPEGEGTDSKPPVANMTGVSTPANGEATASTAQPAADATTSRAPVQRLESLKPAEPGSAAPAPRRTASARGRKPAVVKPTFTGRRSKDERAALAKELSQRDKQRADEAEKAAKRKPKPAVKKFDNKDRGASGPVGGPFSGGSVPKDRRATSQITSFGSRATHIKREDGDDWGGSGGRGGRGGGGGGGGGGGSRGTGEDGGYISSGDEDGDDIPRKDIDAIEVSSDEEGGAPSAAKTRRPGQEMLLPVRIGREEHRERVVGINTEASSEDAAKILQQAEASGGEIKAEPGMIGKLKGKAKGTEAMDRPFKGMWQDHEELDAPTKSEPVAEDEDMTDAVPIGNSITTAVDLSVTTPEGEAGVEAATKDDALVKTEEKKARSRGKKAEPVLQTDEEKAEYQRFVEFTAAVRQELGGAPGEAHGEPRDESSYLFQLPPLMPKAQLPEAMVKEENPMPMAAPGAKAVKPKAADKKIERKRKEYRVAPGAVGRLRVHKSGRVSLRWGNETFDLMPANPTSFEQEVVEVENVPEHMRTDPNEGGDGTSFGRVKGKFVAMPNWKAMIR